VPDLPWAYHLYPSCSPPAIDKLKSTSVPFEPPGGSPLRRAGPPRATMKILDFAEPERSYGRLGRVAAVTLIGATVIAVLYFGQEVLIPTAPEPPRARPSS